MCYTPGPNNFLLVASGINHGFRRSQPHVFGVASGFFTLLFVSGLGLAVLIQQYVWLDIVIKLLGCIFLFYLSYRLTMAKTVELENGGNPANLIKFYEAFSFQFINPKGLVMALSVQGNFFPAEASLTHIFVLSSVFALLVGLSSSEAYVMLGMFINKKIKSQKYQKGINNMMGLLLALTTLYLFIQNLGDWFLSLF